MEVQPCILLNLSHVMRKPAFCINYVKIKVQISCTFTGQLSFRYIDSSVHLLPKSKISSL